jgi:hypothetical protein
LTLIKRVAGSSPAARVTNNSIVFSSLRHFISISCFGGFLAVGGNVGTLNLQNAFHLGLCVRIVHMDVSKRC